ncbi:hypothetical protein D3C76_912530 [compost metagenome]
MQLRLPCLFALTLLAACASDEPAPSEKDATPAAPALAALPAHMRELSGMLSSTQGYLPAGSEVEVALLVVDDRDRPRQLLASDKLVATGGAMPFRLVFNPQYFPNSARVELRARVIQSGQLAWRLRPLQIFQAESRALGELRMERAP